MTVIDPMTGETRVHTTQPDPCGEIYWAQADGPVVHVDDRSVLVEREPGSGILSKLFDIDESANGWGVTTSAGRDGVVAVVIGTPSDDGGSQVVDIHLFGPDDQPIASPLELDIDAVGMDLAPSGEIRARVRTVVQ
jgi:hypothetical protein